MFIKPQFFALIFLFVLSSLAPCVSFSKPVSKETARQAADNFLFSKKLLQKNITRAVKARNYAEKTSTELKITRTRTIRDDDGILVAYVHELSPEGYIITSADTEVRAVLGYSFKGKFPFVDTKDNALLHLLKWDVRARLKAIEEAKSSTQSPVAGRAPGRESDSVETYKAINATPVINEWGPWLTTNWHQRSPYNDKVPYKYPSEPSRGRRPVGCVSTAISQLANYWIYPSSISFDSATTPEGDAYTTKTGINIDGDANSFGFPSFLELNDALATIDYSKEEAFVNFAIGIKVEMNYGLSSSGAFMHSIAPALKDDLNFGSAEFGYWSKKLESVKSNLKKGWPVLLTIHDSVNGGAHEVVIDGYKDSGEFHINLGWGGTSEDTWYNLPNIINFDTIWGVVFDITPYRGWYQFGADEKNSFRTIYSAPVDNIAKNKWQISPLLDYKFKGLVVGYSNKIYATLGPNNVNQGNHPGVWVINQYGDREEAYYVVDDDNGLTYPVQNFQGEIFVAGLEGGIYKLDTVTKHLTKIYQQPSGQGFETLKMDPNGYLYASSNTEVVSLGSDGTHRWTFTTPSGETILPIEPSIDASKDNLYIGYCDSGGPSPHTAYLAAINRQSGSFRYHKSFSVQYCSSNSAGIASIGSDGTVYVNTYGKLYALTPGDTSFSEIWVNDTLITKRDNAPAIGVDGTVYMPLYKLVSGNHKLYLGAYDPSNGASKWEVSLSLDSDYDSIGKLYVASNGVVVLSMRRDNTGSYDLYAYKDMDTYADQLWTKSLGTDTGEEVAFGSGETIYVLPGSAPGGMIYAVSEGDIGDPYGGGMGYTNNEPPVAPSSPSPLDNAVEQAIDITLSWVSSDPDGHLLKYDLLIGELKEDTDLVFFPEATQLTSTNYNISGLTRGVKYLWKVIATDGQSVAEGPTWSFDTVNDPPSVTLVTPTTGSIGIGVNTAITATFSESVDELTINDSTFTLDNGVTGTVTYAYDTKIATLTPHSYLAFSTTYTATITTEIKDLLGTNMASDYSWSFTTGEAPDTTPPSVSNSSPSEGGTGVSVNAAITATFNEGIDSSTISSLTFSIAEPIGNIVGTVSYNSTNATATFTPAYDLDYSTTYTATITTGVKDLAGNNMVSNYTWTFATEVDPNLGTDPGSGATTGGGGSPSGGGGGDCFIATAAYGSYLDPRVMVLRDFRDNHLLTNVIGTGFVAYYYKISPPISDFIREYEALRMATRWALTPIVLGIEYPFAVSMLFGFAVIIVIYRWSRNRKAI